ncbi:Uncharacterised protein [Mycobacteroides abscessus subsp. abscessus]|nr:Uncharacterised protein [Mycobacteroides abscessus subsp. abscessus]SHR66645.1 Uncharacterised protein [Mycobacteroides abscessus subsp. abscessus]SIB81747.1 Uncharacterised protein [Mycobacteroides abscessus subsp. abscessus]SKT24934.1 Uncharacterised protein [Mycobacteroides abscessus subsp. abscessus]
MLQALAGQGGAARRRAQHEAAGHLVGGGPQAVAGALEAEHRIEDVQRDHRLVVGRVRRAHRGERGGGSGLVDALVQDLSLRAFLVRQHQFGIHRGVQLAVAVVDLQRREPRVHAEGAGLVGDDRNDAVTDVLVAQQFFEGADQRHGGGDFLLARALLDRGIGLRTRQRERARRGATRRHKATQGAAPVQHVADFRSLGAGVVIRRQIGVLFELGVRDRDALLVAEVLQVIQRQLLHLVSGVAALEVLAQRVALDGLGQDDRRLALVLGGRAVGGVYLAIVVAAALEVPNLGVGKVFHQFLGARIAPEEVLADVGTVIGLVGLVVAVGGGVHQVHQCAVAVGVQQGIPFAAPHHLDDIPAGAAEEGLQLLDDLAVAAHRAVEALQVAVDDERQVVQALGRGDVCQAARFGLVHFAVAEEGPHPLIGGVLDAAVTKVVVEPRLHDRVHRSQPHGNRWELPEIGHQARMRVGG